MLQGPYYGMSQFSQSQPAVRMSQQSRVLLPYDPGMASATTRPTQPKATTPVTLEDAISAKSDDARWTILSKRSCPRSALPPFLYGVTTTHIYCRPTCPARLARRANVVFFDTASDAVRAGYRPCRRCKPDVVSSEAASCGGEAILAGDGEEGRRKVIRAVEIIREKAEQGQRIGLRELSEEVGLSRWHLLRIFRKQLGVTPKEMADGVVTDKHRRANDSGAQSPEGTAAVSTESDTPPSQGLPRTPDGEREMLEGPASEDLDSALLDFDFGSFDMDLTIPELWESNQSAEDLLRDLFPEVYQEDAKSRS